ncbi:MAG: decapping endonuclease targeting mRNA [Phylliscum demangeonii]|nr:MAG: decapping endonuclease targeting mRNA [Phylliscum demangeonii]
MSSFPISPIDRFAGQAATIKRPQEIACFSYDDQHVYHSDDSSLRYYYPPRVGADLSRGFDRFQKLDDTADEHLDSLLDTLMHLEKKTTTATEVDVVTWRGMMTKILCTPYDPFGSFEMNATRFQVCYATTSLILIPLPDGGDSFIEENHAFKLAQHEAQVRQPVPPGTPSQDLMSFWGNNKGYKFETLSLMPAPWAETSRDFIEGREEHVVNNHAQYCCVVRTGLGGTSVILGGEVDAIWDAKPDHADQPINWVELKTAAEPLTERDRLRFERKLLKFWAQSFLLGVPKIIVGFRSEHGVLQRVQELATTAIPSVVRQRGASWDGNVCINFAAACLQWLRDVLDREPDGDGGGVWRIRKRERSSVIELQRLEHSGYGDLLTPRFVQWRQSLGPR